MDILFVVIIILIGVVLILLEIFLLPGISVAGVAGVALFAGAIYMAYEKLGPTAGNVALLCCILFTAAGVYLFIKGKVLERMSLQTNIDSKVDLIVDTDVSVGDTGYSLSRLAPMGKISIHGKTFMAKTLSDFIEEESAIKVINIEGNTLIVESLADVTPSTEQNNK